MIGLQELKDKTAVGVAMDRLFSAIPNIENASDVPVLYAKMLKEDEFRKNWVNRNRACLIKGAVAHWPAVTRWKEKTYWQSQLKNFEVEVYPHENFMSMDLQNKGKEVMGFHEAIERLYAYREPVFSLPSKIIRPENEYGALLADMKGFEFLPDPDRPRIYPHMRVFIYRGASTAWHYHHADETLMCQINGPKRVALLPASIPRAKEVDHFLNGEQYLKGGRLNPMLKLRPGIVEVGEGDALYIPPYWFHAVVPADQEIGYTLAYCWRSPWQKMGNFSNYFVRKLYRRAIWPINRRTKIMPFVAVYAGASFLLGKLSGRI